MTRLYNKKKNEKKANGKKNAGKEKANEKKKSEENKQNESSLTNYRIYRLQIVDLTLYHYAALKYICTRIRRHFLRLDYPRMERRRIKKNRKKYEKKIKAIKIMTVNNKLRFADYQNKLARLKEDEQNLVVIQKGNKSVIKVRCVHADGTVGTEDWEIETQLWAGKYEPKNYTELELKDKISKFATWIQSRWHKVKMYKEADEIKKCYPEQMIELQLDDDHADSMIESDDNSSGQAMLWTREIIRLIKKWEVWKLRLKLKLEPHNGMAESDSESDSDIEIEYSDSEGEESDE